MLLQTGETIFGRSFQNSHHLKLRNSSRFTSTPLRREKNQNFKSVPSTNPLLIRSGHLKTLQEGPSPKNTQAIMRFSDPASSKDQQTA